MADDEGVKSPSIERMKWMKAFGPWLNEHFKRQPKDESVLLAVAQYWADEANDAVHLTTLASSKPVPDFFHNDWGDEPSAEGTHGVDWEHSPEWDDNGLSIRCFQAYCGELGSQELPSSAQSEPFAIARRTPSGAQLTWLGRCQRAWLDLPNAGLPGFMGEEDDDLDFDERPPLDVTLPAQKLEPIDVKCLEVIASDPFAEGPRRVWADMFLSKNDPRGALMKTRRPSEELLFEKGEFWLGELNQVVPLGSATFEYGSLSEAVAAFTEETAELAESPWWLSVHTLRFSGEEQPFSKRMAGLRHVSGLTNVGLLALADFGGVSKLESLHASVSFADAEVLNALPLKALKQLSLTLSGEGPLSKLSLATSAWPSLEHLHLSRLWQPAYEWDEDEEAEQEVVLLHELRAAFPNLQRVSISSADSSGLPAGWQLTMEKGKDREAIVSMARLGPCTRPQLLDAMIDGLPPSVDELVLQPSIVYAPKAGTLRGKKTRIAG